MAKRNKSKVVEERWMRKEQEGRRVREDEAYVREPVQARNDKQKEFLKLLNTKDIIVFSAVAGCGKSYVTMSEVTDWLKKGVYDRLTIARPNVVMGRSLGSLKGDMRQKYEILLAPMVEVIKERYGAGFYESSISNGTIELLPLEYIRGKNFSHVTVIDEAQLVTPDEMYTIVTRLAEGGKLIILGDPNQKDQKGLDGITWLLNFVDRHNLHEHFGYVEADSDHIERGGLCKAVVKAKEYDIKHGED